MAPLRLKAHLSGSEASVLVGIAVSEAAASEYSGTAASGESCAEHNNGVE